MEREEGICRERGYEQRSLFSVYFRDFRDPIGPAGNKILNIRNKIQMSPFRCRKYTNGLASTAGRALITQDYDKFVPWFPVLGVTIWILIRKGESRWVASVT